MKPELEDHLWNEITFGYFEGPIGNPGEFKTEGRTPRDVIAEMVAEGLIASPKQAWRTLEKWSGRGLYDYGVTMDLGWRTQRERP